MDFSESMKKLILAGIGAVAITADKSKEMIDELVKKGELTVEQGKVLNEELKHKAQSKVSETLVDNVENLSEEDFIPNIRIDYEIEDFSELNSHLLSELELFEPCGFGNTKPKLSTSTDSVKQAWTFSDGQHLRLQFQKNSLNSLLLTYPRFLIAKNLVSLILCCLTVHV